MAIYIIANSDSQPCPEMSTAYKQNTEYYHRPVYCRIPYAILCTNQIIRHKLSDCWAFVFVQHGQWHAHWNT